MSWLAHKSALVLFRNLSRCQLLECIWRWTINGERSGLESIEQLENFRSFYPGEICFSSTMRCLLWGSCAPDHLQELNDYADDDGDHDQTLIMIMMMMMILEEGKRIGRGQSINHFTFGLHFEQTCVLLRDEH